MTAQAAAPEYVAERRLLARDASLVERIRIYRRGPSLEVDTSSFFRIVRHRVLFQEVELMTLHRGRSVLSMLGLGLLGLSIGLIAPAIADAGGGTIALTMLSAGAAGIVLGALLPDWVISVQSRRSWVRMRLGWSHGKARRVFDQLAADVHETQARIERERPTAQAVRSPFAPPPVAAPLGGRPILPLPGDPGLPLESPSDAARDPSDGPSADPML